MVGVKEVEVEIEIKRIMNMLGSMQITQYPQTQEYTQITFKWFKFSTLSKWENARTNYYVVHIILCI